MIFFTRNVDGFYIWLCKKANLLNVDLIKVHEIMISMISYIQIPTTV